MQRLGDDVWAFWEGFRSCFRTQTRDTSEQAYWYWRGQLTMGDARNFANIERRLHGGDGHALQQFMSDSPWRKQAVCEQIQDEIRAHPGLQHGGLLILDESSDETAGEEQAGAGRQHNGRLGKVELSVTTV
ncbi:MAG: transposase, partial [Anaerolineales bacterium]